MITLTPVIMFSVSPCNTLLKVPNVYLAQTKGQTSNSFKKHSCSNENFESTMINAIVIWKNLLYTGNTHTLGGRHQ